MSFSHVPVMLPEVLNVLSPKAGQAYVDCTAGLGGHAAAMATRVAGGEPVGRVVLCDLDQGNLERASGAVSRASDGLVQVDLLQGNFAQVPYEMESRGVVVDMLLADFGFASPQVDDASRGFSFQREGPLDMRMDVSAPSSAADLVASLSERELAQIIDEYGEERSAKRIAKKLVQERAKGPILTTTHLAELIRGVVGWQGSGGTDPATRTFQALRIAVNDEIGSINALLAAVSAEARRVMSASVGGGSGSGGRWLRPGSRLAFITFHSLEDRPVKQTFAELIKLGAEDLTDGMQRASEEEIAGNPRSRSAKLRAIRLPDRD
ncbi:MAG: 16S rRNA (cytosine(1402)-N(4))-methyltransferase RsmH [Planctomycetota bacterium]|nr:16S rRNA (cytosine(1402)-N(4))-methyltransferase RsmH [Planctomycetota bacterium]